MSKWFSHGGIILEKGQLYHSYTFWTMPIMILSQVYFFFGAPSTSGKNSKSINEWVCNLFVTCFHEFRIYEFFFTLFFFWNKVEFFDWDKKLFLQPFIFTRRHFVATSKENNKFFTKENRRFLDFGIRKNMSRTGYLCHLHNSRVHNSLDHLVFFRCTLVRLCIGRPNKILTYFLFSFNWQLWSAQDCYLTCLILKKTFSKTIIFMSYLKILEQINNVFD